MYLKYLCKRCKCILLNILNLNFTIMKPSISNILICLTYLFLLVLTSCKEPTSDGVGNENGTIPDYVYFNLSNYHVVGEEFACVDTLKINSNYKWEIVNNTDWCSFSMYSGFGDQDVIVSFEENKTGLDRTAEVIMKYNNNELKLKLTQYAPMKTGYVEVDWDNNSLSAYNNIDGSIELELRGGELSRFKENQAIVLEERYGNAIRVIKTVQVEGDKVKITTEAGNMSNLFKDISFRLITDPNSPKLATRSFDGRVVAPSKIELCNGTENYQTIYDENDPITKSYNPDIVFDYNWCNAILFRTTEYYVGFSKADMDIGLDCVFDFTFGSDESDGSGLLGKLESLDFSLEGKFNLDLSLGCNFKKDLDIKIGDDETRQLILGPATRNIRLTYFVGFVPVYIVIPVNECVYGELVAGAAIQCYWGCNVKSDAQVGISYTDDEGMYSNVNFEFEAESSPVILNTKGSLTAKGSFYPRLDFLFYGLGGPTVEIMPYMGANFEVGNQTEIGYNFDGGYVEYSYEGWQTELNAGVLYRLGFTTGFYKKGGSPIQTDVKEFTPAKTVMWEGPKKIELYSPAEDTTLTGEENHIIKFKVFGKNNLTGNYAPMSDAFVEFKYKENGVLKTLHVCSNSHGIVSMTWHPILDSDVISARIKGSEAYIHNVTFDPTIIENTERSILEPIYKDVLNSRGSIFCNKQWLDLDIAPLECWRGVNEVDSIGRVVDLYLHNVDFTDHPNVDLRGMVAMKKLDLSRASNLNSLNLSGCADLEELNLGLCSNLTSLTLDGCTNLKTINCSSTALKSLDVSGLSDLTYLNCAQSNVSSLSVSGCNSLKEIYCQNNSISSLSVGGLINLEYLNCTQNNMTSLSVGGCSSLKTLICHTNDLSSLSVGGLADLEALNCSSNKIASINLRGCSKLTDASLVGMRDYLKTVYLPAQDDLSYSVSYWGEIDSELYPEPEHKKGYEYPRIVK